MSLSPAELTTIQHAGVALHRASQALSDALRARAQSMVARVASHPLHADSEAAFTQFRQLAGLSEELSTLEERLKSAYAAAAEMRRVDKVLTAPPQQGKKREHKKVSKKKPLKLTHTPPRPLSPNDLKVLAYLKGILKPDQWTPLTGSVVSAGSGLPKGSVGVSLMRLVASGSVKREGGAYQAVSHLP